MKHSPTDIINSDGSALGVRLDPNNATKLILTGKFIGTSTLTLVYPDKTEERYEVVVQGPRKHIARQLRPGFVAFVLSLPPENAVAGYLGLNDYVLVYTTTVSDPEKKTRLLMKNIRVWTEATAYQRTTPTRIHLILEVTNDEAKLLKSGTENGSLSLGLVAEADTKNEKTLQDRKGDPVPSK